MFIKDECVTEKAKVICFKGISQNLPGRSAENTENFSYISRFPAGVRTWYLSINEIEMCHVCDEQLSMWKECSNGRRRSHRRSAVVHVTSDSIIHCVYWSRITLISSGHTERLSLTVLKQRVCGDLKSLKSNGDITRFCEALRQRLIQYTTILDSVHYPRYIWKTRRFESWLFWRFRWMFISTDRNYI
jgi:hypothetical protein